MSVPLFSIRLRLKPSEITGISPEAEPSAARLAELIKYVKENDIKIIYFGKNASEKIAKTLAGRSGRWVAVLKSNRIFNKRGNG